MRIISMDMPPLTPPDKPLSPVLWRVLLLLACVLVFAFALHAKVAVYGDTQPHPSTSSKLWRDGAKFEPPQAAPIGLLWLTVILSTLLAPTIVRPYQASPVVPSSERRRRQHVRRFLRPPPSL